MKKLFAVFITATLLVGCNNNDTTAVEEPENMSPAELNSMEIEQGLKAGTTEYDYAALLADEVPVNAKMKFVGTVAKTNDTHYELTSSTSTSSDEIVIVDDIRLGERTKVEENTSITVYGSYHGKNADGIPVIKGIFIDVE